MDSTFGYSPGPRDFEVVPEKSTDRSFAITPIANMTPFLATTLKDRLGDYLP
jgi:hypothetical protein